MENKEKLCINCMEKMESADVCEHCGFHFSEYTVKPHHLDPFSILKARYLLGRVLGEGGFGITYVATDLQEEKKVAIKELFVTGLLIREHTRTVLVDGSYNKRKYYNECKRKFVQEANLLQTMSDKQGIVDIYDYFEENATAYIVMEYLPGEDLRTILKKNGGSISFEDTFELLRPVMRSLIEMHSIGIYHRDISPDNIRILPDRRVKLIDFGGAKYIVNDSASEYVALKHGYAPPEQYVTEYKIGAWMDVYALAATFYRCITGKMPKVAIERISNDDIEKPSQLGVKISQQAEKVLLKAMALKTDERYIDMREFYEELKKVPEVRELSTPPSKKEAEYKQDLYRARIQEINDEHSRDREHIWSISAIIILIFIIVIAIVSSRI